MLIIALISVKLSGKLFEASWEIAQFILCTSDIKLDMKQDGAEYNMNILLYYYTKLN